ncbi:hypothetical protein BEL04_21630 [Mucilaginibacter sp. PPCGB 2223]|uniref:PorP/SprF family type IX secretion system membrane protein n=1 Tax=Mucilaginibacter sp. PPCGB 2223 TaxID=1886027 RepID=UPI0008244E58|nr:PorP/SprF family type IX secretion system membrane protein [Mucilaginibacter sp. PPCGB 2223]OCX50388.1 hypothetical protein BEL04_21630 [Mucilaginibacter sp. PPCGB 2223]
MKKLTLNTVILLLVLAGTANAQVDPHFSQYYAYPMWLNPALTGVIDGDARITANLKDQWRGVDNGYKTGGVSGDLRTSDKVALGFNMIDQSAGTAGYNYLATYGSFAYQIPVSDNQYQKLSFGIQAGFINRSFDANKLQFDNQYNSSTGGYDGSMSNFENFTTTSAMIFDASAGVFYYDGNPDNDVNLFGGVAAAHLTPAKNPVNSDGLNGTLPFRYTIHGGLRIRASELVDITTHALYIGQEKNQICAAGMNLELRFQADHSLILGGMYRLNDAAVANLGFHMGNTIIGMSYDYTTSPLQTAMPQGTYEISISYLFKHHLSNRDQVCPRL